LIIKHYYPPKIEFYILDGIEERVDKLDKLKEFYLDIENMIDKVKIKYPNLIYTLILTRGLLTDLINMMV
jgi:hypothetical protein